jgi:hypothetical protein
LHIDGPDNQIEDSVFFCAGIGIKLTAQANYFEGIHAFTGAADRYPLGALYVPIDAHHSSGTPVGQHGNRFVHCYWDYSGNRGSTIALLIALYSTLDSLFYLLCRPHSPWIPDIRPLKTGVRIENPFQIHFTENYVIGLPSLQSPSAYFELVAIGEAIKLDGLRITGSVFHSASKDHPVVAFQLNETQGYFHRGTHAGDPSGMEDVLVAGNTFRGVKGAASRVRRALTHTAPATDWVFDLCGDLLLGESAAAGAPGSEPEYANGLFGHLQYSLRLDGNNSHRRTRGASDATGSNGASAFVRSAITAVDGCRVTVSTDTPVVGTVYLDADQSTQDLTGHVTPPH